MDYEECRALNFLIKRLINESHNLNEVHNVIVFIAMFRKFISPSAGYRTIKEIRFSKVMSDYFRLYSKLHEIREFAGSCFTVKLKLMSEDVIW